MPTRDMARRIIETANEGICIADSDFVIKYVNKRSCELLGYSISEVVGRPVADFIHPDDRPQHQQLLDERRKGVSRRYEVRLLRRDGAAVWVLVSATPITDRRSRFVGSFAMFTDITHRKEAEADLDRSRALAQLYLDIAPCIILAINRDGRIGLLNREGRRILECGDVDPTGRDWFETFIPSDLRGQVRGVFSQLMAGGSPETARFENEVITLRGNRRTILWHNNIVRDENGNVLGTLSSGEDITVLKQAEQKGRELQAQLRRAERIKSLGMLAGSIAHDFNNFLTAMAGHVDLALREAPEGSAVAQHIRNIGVIADRAALLCRQLLAYSGRGAVKPQPLDLSRLVEDTASMLHVAASKKARLEYELAANMPMAMADAGQMRQVLMNLVMNASEALEDRPGTIRVSTGCVHCGRDYLRSAWGSEDLPEAWYVFLEVSDTGCGMDRATQMRMFDPFFTTKKKGTGLGLAAVLGIVRSLHGAIHVRSEPGAGSVFRVLLPAAGDPGPSCGAPTAGDAVLIVDDEPEVLEVAKDMARQAGFEVFAAADTAQAMALYEANHRRIRCVMIDLTMGAEELLEALRRTDPAVRVVLVSGAGDDELRRRCVETGAAGFLEKPFSRESLAAALRRAMESPDGQKT